MAVIKNSVEIARPPEAVFDYCVDLRNELEWNPDAQSVEKITEGPIGAGTKFRVKWKQSGLIEVECTKHERPGAWRNVNGGPLAVVFDGRVVPSGNGSKLAVRFDVRPQGTMKLLFPFLLLIIKRSERRNMQRIKQALEKAYLTLAN